MGCRQGNKLLDDINHMMKDFYFRLIRLDFIISKIQEFNKSKRNYYDFWVLSKILGIHTLLPIQSNFWQFSYVSYYEISLEGILLIFFFLCQGEKQKKLDYIKYYMSSQVNLSKEQDDTLVMNYNEFKKIITVYFSCLTTIAHKILFSDPDYDEDNDYEKNQLIRDSFNEEVINNFTEYLLRSYVKKNYYVNAGRFFDENIDLLLDDYMIRKSIIKYKVEISQKEKARETRMSSLNNPEINSQTSYESDYKSKVVSICKCCSKKKRKLI